MDEKFITRWNVPHAVGVIDEKHIPMKPKESGSDYYNYKDLFSLVLLELINAEYRFLWVNVGSSGQIFKRSDLSEIEDGTLGLSPTEPLGEGGPNFALFLAG